MNSGRHRKEANQMHLWRRILIHVALIVYAGAQPTHAEDGSLITREYFGLEGFHLGLIAPGADEPLDPQLRDLLAWADRMGVGIVGSNNVNWDRFEPAPPVDGTHTYHWETFDVFARACAKYGLRIQTVTKPNSPWACANKDYRTDEGTEVPLEEYWADWGEFINAFVERYDGDGVNDAPGIDYPALGIVQVANEIEVPIHWTHRGGTPESYHAILRIAKERGNTASKEVSIARAAFNYWNIGDFNTPIGPTLLQDSRIIRHVKRYLDVAFGHPDDMNLFGVHANYHYSSMIPVAEWLRGNLKSDVPIYSEDTRSILIQGQNELPTPQRDFIDNPEDPAHADVEIQYLQDQAITVAKKLVCGLAAGMEHVIMSAAVDWPSYHIHSWRRCGLFGREAGKLKPRPAVYAYKTVTDILTGAQRHVDVLSHTPDLCLFKFVKDGKPIYVAWSDTGTNYKLPVLPARVTTLPTKRGQTAPEVRTIAERVYRLGAIPVFIEPERSSAENRINTGEAGIIISFRKDLTDWGRVAAAVKGTSSSRYVSFDVMAPSGTIMQLHVKESTGEEWRLGPHVVLTDRWQKVTLPVWEIFRPSSRVFTTEEAVTVIPAKDLPTEFFGRLARPPEGDGTLEPERIRTVYIDFAHTNGMEPLGECLYHIRDVRLVDKSPLDEAIDEINTLTVTADAAVSLGPVEPLWADAWLAPPRYEDLPQRLVRLPVFGENKAVPAESINGEWDWQQLDDWVQEARRKGTVVMQIVGRDVPEWLWHPAEDNKLRTGTGEWLRGNLRPPRDFAAYQEIHRRIAHHLNVARKLAVEYFEFWTEPDIKPYYLGDFADYCRMYEAMARGIKRADPKARVGMAGFATYRLSWIEGMLTYCAQNDVPLDFVSIHEYTLNTKLYEHELKHLRFVLSQYPEFRDIPIVVSEWNTPFIDGPISESLKTGYRSAAFAASAIYRMIEGGARFAAAWNPEIPAKESPFGSWLHQGFVLKDGTPRPKFNAMKCYAMMSGERIKAGTNAAVAGVEAFARRDGDRLWIMIWWHVPEPKAEGIDRPLTVKVSGLREYASAEWVKYLIGRTHSNYNAGPGHQELEKISTSTIAIDNGQLTIEDRLEILTVALYEIRLRASQ